MDCDAVRVVNAAVALFTVRVKACGASGLMPLLALIVIGYEPTLPSAGVPLNTPAVVNVTPLGNAPVSLKVGAGKPVAVAVNDPALSTVNVALFALVMAGACPTVSVKFCVALGVTPLLAVMAIGNVPLTVAVPESTPAELNVTPLGRLPVSLKVIVVGNPVAITVNVPAALTVNVVLFALVIAGDWVTVNLKFWVAFGEMPFEAVMVIGYVPPVFAAGVPLSTPADERVTPLGSAPVSLKVGAGKPVAVTVNDPADPTVNVVLAALVIESAWLTVSVKFWTALGATPLLAVKVMLYVPPVPAAGVPLRT